jgi:SOS-response transcriptional repressor LexA
MTVPHGKARGFVIAGYDTSAIADGACVGFYVSPMDGSISAAMDPAWLKAELEKPGRSQSALARFMEVAPETVNRICNGKRQIKAAEADQIRAYLSATTLNGDYATISRLPPRPIPTAELIVRGTVEAGSWREVPIVDYAEAETLPAPRFLVDQGAFALKVSGPSMNMHYPEGSYVVVQPWHGGPLPIGKHVVVERSRPDGLVETTVKQLVEADDGKLQLIPRSNHPAHQAPVPYDDVDGVTVQLIGRVIWAITPV